MSFFKDITQEKIWQDFLLNEQGKVMPDTRLIKDVSNIIEEGRFLSFTEDYFNNFPIPRYHEIKKFNTKKTRNVFIYPNEQNIILKVLAFYILNHYNNKFISNSLAYTRGRGVKTAFNRLAAFNLKPNELIYKNDFSDYFNKIDIDLLEPKLAAFFDEIDTNIKDFILRILRNPNTTYKGAIRIFEQKGVMAGTPISGILANIYMHDVDKIMLKKGFRYLRYADDTLIVGQDALDFFKEELKKLSIDFNYKKSETYTLETGVTFLGFYYKGNIIDISAESKAKMKSRMKRRAKWYRKWMLDNDVRKTIAIRHYIKGINRKLFSAWDDSINWSLWYLPNINTTNSIKFLDEYFVNCIRYLNSGTWKRGKKYYAMSYKDIKKLGFQSLVNTYYRIKKDAVRTAKELESIQESIQEAMRGSIQ